MMRVILFFALCLLANGCNNELIESNITSSAAIDTSENPLKRQHNSNCLAGNFNNATKPLRLKRQLPNHHFTDPVDLVTHPGDPNVSYLIERKGEIHRIHWSNNTSVKIFDLATEHQLSDCQACGLSGMAFDPQFARANATQNRVYFAITALKNTGSSTTQNMNANDSTLHSEIIMTHSPDRGKSFATNNQGDLVSQTLFSIKHQEQKSKLSTIRFGLNGKLYLALADDNLNATDSATALDTTSPFGKIIQLTPPEQFYTPQNEIKSHIIAKGLHSAFQWHLDKTLEKLWIIDTPDTSRNDKNDPSSKIYTMPSTSSIPVNFGWPCQLDSLQSHYQCQINSNPEHAFSQIAINEDSSLIGGLIYRGSHFPAFYGKYIYADKNNGKIWVMTTTGTEISSTELLLDSGLTIDVLTTDHQGELVIVSSSSGGIYRILPPETAMNESESEQLKFTHLPQRLSETGCFTRLNTLQASEGVIHYDIVEPSWLGNIRKAFYFALPDDQVINSSFERWKLPAESVLIKTLSQNSDHIETQFSIKHATDQWSYLSYQWNADQSDAYLITTDASQSLTGHLWPIKNNQTCVSCHNQVAGYQHSLKTSQMHRIFNNPHNTNHTQEQLTALANAGFIPSLTIPLQRPNSQDKTASLEARARSYLDSNCLHCHHSANSLENTFDLSLNRPLNETGLCQLAINPIDQIALPLIQAGSETNSELIHRMKTLNDAQMPPSISHYFGKDQSAIALLSKWINQMDNCTDSM